MADFTINASLSVKALKDFVAQGVVVCPESKQRLSYCNVAELNDQSLRGQVFGTAIPAESKLFEQTPSVLLREDAQRAYPVVDGIPVLLVPEMFVSPGFRCDISLAQPKYAEAYKEIKGYNAIALNELENIRTSDDYHRIEAIRQVPEQERLFFPDPWEIWLDAVYDSAAQMDAYQHVAPVIGKRLLQVGGKGLHAVRFLLAGAAECWLITPVLGEIRFSMELARLADVAEGLHCVLGIAEELPFQSEYFDAIYSGGCIHHTETSSAFPECARTLKGSGKFAAMDPFRTFIYTVGTALFGKRGVDHASCQPLTKKRLEPFHEAFRDSRVIHHGTMLRYPLLLLHKLGFPSSLSTARLFNRLDDGFCSMIPGLRRMGGSIALLGEKCI